MIIDCILDRYNGSAYDPKEFYLDMLGYGGAHGCDISWAMDFKMEETIKKALCNYIDDEQYNPLIKNFINEANWLIPDDGIDWTTRVTI